MSLFTRRGWTLQAQDVIPPRGDVGRVGSVTVTRDTAMRQSAVWAALRLRAGLLSTMPLDVYRKIGAVQVEVPKPPVLRQPGGAACDAVEWLYASQVDLDRGGNTFGLITAKDGAGRPAVIELQPLDHVSVKTQGTRITGYRIGGEDFAPEMIWHERQYTLAGLPVGLSPVAFAAYSIGSYLSAQQFVNDWFLDGQLPAARLFTKETTPIPPEMKQEIKAGYRAAVRNRDIFLHNGTWDFEMVNATSAQPQFIEAMQYGTVDIARFFDIPADLIDGAASGSAVTYANISQRNLQLLIMHLGPMVIRRENALSRLLAEPRFVKFNTDALLRLDPQTRATTVKTRIDSRVLAPSEARALDNLPPFTAEQEAEFDRLFGSRQAAPAKTGVPA